MELLAILSTIILVGTIATLILAVASYILYKARERRGSTANAQMVATHQHQQQQVVTSPAQGYARQALPHGASRYPHEEAQQAPQAYRQPQAARPSQAAAYVPPQHLRTQGATQPEQWEYGVEAFAPARRGTSEDVVPGRASDNDLSWLG